MGKTGSIEWTKIKGRKGQVRQVAKAEAVYKAWSDAEVRRIRFENQEDKEICQGHSNQNMISWADQDVVLVRYGEITLKDRWTRNNWERILAGNISFDLQAAGLDYGIRRRRGQDLRSNYGSPRRRDHIPNFWRCLLQPGQDGAP